VNPNEHDNLNNDTPQLGADEERSMPLGVGNFDEQDVLDPLAGGETKKRVDTGALLIGGVILVAIGGLFSMRTLARIAMPAPTDPMYEQTVMDFLDAPDVTTQDAGVWTDLKDDFTKGHVPLEGVHRNPFIIWETSQNTDEPVNLDPKIDQEALTARRREERSRAINAEAERFRLQMVLLGHRPLANLNDQIVRIGETIQLDENSTVFRIAAIRNDSVKLVAEEPALDLVVEIDVILLRQ